MKLDFVNRDAELAELDAAARRGGLLIGEVKWRRLSPSAHATILRDLQDRWHRCTLASRYPSVRFQVIDSRCISAPIP